MPTENSRTTPCVVSTIVPTGTCSASGNGMNFVCPGSFTSTLPDSGSRLTFLPCTGGGAIAKPSMSPGGTDEMTACGESSLVIVPTPFARAIRVPTGFDRLTAKFSSGSTLVSPRTATVIVLLVSPGAKVAVPLAAV